MHWPLGKLSITPVPGKVRRASEREFTINHAYRSMIQLWWCTGRNRLVENGLTSKQQTTLKVLLPNLCYSSARSYSIRPIKIVTALIDAAPKPLTFAISVTPEMAGTGRGLEEAPRRSPERGWLAGYGIRRGHFRSSSPLQRCSPHRP